jgi:predicted nuclease of predicted toxin-antitoxin system
VRFVVDECTGPRVARWLEEQGHDVVSIYDVDKGAEDVDVLARAVRELRVVVTIDKDFGELVFRDRLPHTGIILLRLAIETAPAKIAVLDQVLKSFAGRIEGNYIVATEDSARLVEFPRH